LYDFNLNNIKKEEVDDVIKYYFIKKNQIKYWKNIFLKMKSNNPVDTWDYQLTFSIWKNKGLSIIPNVNLITNIGFGEMAVHTKNPNNIYANIKNRPILPIIYLDKVSRCKKADKRYYNLFIKRISFLKIIKKIIVILNLKNIKKDD